MEETKWMLREAAVLRRASPWEQIPAFHRMFLKYSSWQAPWRATPVAWKLVNMSINSKVVPCPLVKCCHPCCSAWLSGALQWSSFHLSRASSPVLCVTGASWAGPVLAHTGSGLIQDVLRARNGYNLTWHECLDWLSDENWDSAILWPFFGQVSHLASC